MHKNELELRALKLALESTGGKVTACKDGQYSCPDLPFENGGRKEFANGLSLQNEYLPSRLSKHADIETRH